MCLASAGAPGEVSYARKWPVCVVHCSLILGWLSEFFRLSPLCERENTLLQKKLHQVHQVFRSSCLKSMLQTDAQVQTLYLLETLPGWKCYQDTLKYGNIYIYM